MERILYIDCFSGISGDMLLGAFLDLGFPEKLLREALKPFGLGKTFELAIKKTSRHDIAALKVEFPELADTQRQSAHTDFSEISRKIEAAPLEIKVKQLAIAIFHNLAMAESKVHQVDIKKVHFHEVGGIDSVADIVGIAAALHWCDIHKVVAPAVPLGTGFTRCRHGVLPLPVPAVGELLSDIPVIHTDIPAELVTPTGAAVLKTVVTDFQPYGQHVPWIVESTGYGAGSRDLAQRPNLLRLQLGHGAATEKDNVPAATYAMDTVCLLEIAIDDMTPEHLGCLQADLFTLGALDVIIHQVLMKKNRPGAALQVFLPMENEEEIVDHLFTHSTTLGIRRSEVKRYILERTSEEVATSLGTVRVKIARDRRNIILNIKPEYEDVLALAKKHHLNLSAVEQQVMAQYQPFNAHGKS